MELINQSVAPAELFISQVDAKNRVGLLVLKATLETDGSGSVRLADHDPVPLYDAAEPTRLGDIPTDLVLRPGPGLDVVLLGSACAPEGKAAPSVPVTLTVAEIQRRLLVTGDRVWVGEGDEARISDPVPFVQMPLTWERAFGGGGEVWLDAQTRIPIQHPANPGGLGFDLAGQAMGTAKAWGCPDGFPRFEAERRLPNIEDPREAITHWTDDPVPYGWGVTPAPVAALLAVKRSMERGDSADARLSEASAPSRSAPPDLQFSVPTAGTPIALTGCHPRGAWWFRWPPLQPRVDFVVGPRTGTFELEPVQLVLFPEEDRLTITYRYQFRLGPHDTASERSLRVRLE